MTTRTTLILRVTIELPAALDTPLTPENIHAIAEAARRAALFTASERLGVPMELHAPYLEQMARREGEMG